MTGLQQKQRKDCSIFVPYKTVNRRQDTAFWSRCSQYHTKMYTPWQCHNAPMYELILGWSTTASTTCPTTSETTWDETQTRLTAFKTIKNQDWWPSIWDQEETCCLEDKILFILPRSDTHYFVETWHINRHLCCRHTQPPPITFSARFGWQRNPAETWRKPASKVSDQHVSVCSNVMSMKILKYAFEFKTSLRMIQGYKTFHVDMFYQLQYSKLPFKTPSWQRTCRLIL